LADSAPRKFVHIFPVKAVGTQDIFFMDAEPCCDDDDLICATDEQPCNNLASGKSEGEASDDENDPSDDIGNIESEGVSLDETTGCNMAIEGNTQLQGMRDGQLHQAPTPLQVSDALKALKFILHPPQKTGASSKHCKLDPFVRIHLEGMQTMLNFYTNAQSATYEEWGASVLQAAISLGRG